ncbi:hypothetical protein HHI36_005304, partial [Cryptolaemus montrouzieri]
MEDDWEGVNSLKVDDSSNGISELEDNGLVLTKKEIIQKNDTRKHLIEISISDDPSVGDCNILIARLS